MNDGINTNHPLTNVARFARCVTTEQYIDETGFVVIQIPFYLTDIETGPSWISRYVDALYGRGMLYLRISAGLIDDGNILFGSAVLMIQIGIHNDIREAYTFLCTNYECEEDEIILVGFSRGVFAARALSFLLDKLGVLRKAGLKHLGVLYEKWQISYQSKNDIKAENE